MKIFFNPYVEWQIALCFVLELKEISVNLTDKVLAELPVHFTFTFTFMHLADAFIQSDLQCIQAIHFFVSMCVPWESNPQPLCC